MTRRFEASCIRSGLAHTGGRKVEAAHLLGWGRNTLTRKIQELGLKPMLTKRMTKPSRGS